MSEDAVKRAFATVARYQNASVTRAVYHVGQGPFALVAVFADGKRIPKAVGFDSVADAEAFRTYADIAAPPARAAMLERMRKAGFEVVEDSFDRFEIVELVPVTPTDKLREIEGMFTREVDRDG